MAARLTICHSNDDIHTEEFATKDAALARAVIMENERHRTVGKSLRQLLPEWASAESQEHYIQFGTNYHYVVVEEIP